MARIFPRIEVIKDLKRKPTEGELFLLEELSEFFDDSVEIYFEPFFNGERPDIILMDKNRGVIIVEVKDWNLEHYYVDERNKWCIKKDNSPTRSPFAQVFSYKNNMFNLHINGLLENKFKDKQFYKVISCYVYFHKQTRNDLIQFYAPIISELKIKLDGVNTAFTSKSIDFNSYEKKREWINSKLKKIERDLYKHSIAKDCIRNIKFPFSISNKLFSKEIYEGFLRYLQPPHHYAQEGISINYTKAQEKLILSDAGRREKVRGVAGSGKSTVLARRAVNAHRRHGGNVLILTYNLTLRMYLRDKINEVREDFSWGAFGIINYHRFIGLSLSSYGVEIEVPEAIKDDKDQLSEYLDKNYYSNESIFEGCNNIEKFDTILIDEVQDYKPQWIKIIRNYFLSDNGEMVLFGDEKQNIYDRETDDERTTKLVHGFGRWNKLTKSFRYKEDSHIISLAKDFQETYFSESYDLDFTDNVQPSLAGLGVNQCVICNLEDQESIVDYVFSMVKKESIHPNDIVILSSKIAQMRKIDYLIRKDARYNERTLTTFETKEAFESPRVNRNDIERIRSNKKYGFNLNSGVLKISTIHSFKGYECPTVFLIVNESDTSELIYVGLTRAKFNLVVFTSQESKYTTFFQDRFETINLLDESRKY